MVQDIVSKADSHSACHKIPCFLYGTRRFITMFTKARHWTLSWASRIQFAPSIPVSVRSSFLHSRYQFSFHFLLLRSCRRISPGLRRFETFRNNKNVLRWGVVSPTPNPPCWRTTPYWLSETAYSVNSQLPSVTGGLPSIHNLRTHHAVVKRTHPTWHGVVLNYEMGASSWLNTDTLLLPLPWPPLKEETIDLRDHHAVCVCPSNRWTNEQIVTKFCKNVISLKNAPNRVIFLIFYNQ
jgi:hypothetical protein